MPEFNPEDGPFLQQVVGSAQRLKPDQVPIRVAIYDALLESSHATAPIKELHSKTGRTFMALHRAVNELCELGLLERVGKLDPLSRTFSIGTIRPSYKPHTRKETKIIEEALLDFQKKGIVLVTGEDVVQRIRRDHPHCEVKDVWEGFLDWFLHRKSQGFITEVTAGEGLSQYGQVRITKAHKSYLEQLLQVRDLLKDESMEGESFRLLAIERAKKIVASPQLMAQLLTTTRRGSRTVERHYAPAWTEGIDQYVPAGDEGITTEALHKIVTEVIGRSMSYINFRSQLAGVETLEVFEKRQVGGRGITRFVRRLKKETFPSNWEDQAKCLYEDPELFFPEGTRGPAVRQAETAKRLCRTCPVRLPCLRTALDSKINYGVRGGIWLDCIDKELPQAERARVLYRVQIGRK